MENLPMTRKEKFNLSKKLLRKLSCNQLLLLLPKIIEKLISENNVLKNIDVTESLGSDSTNNTENLVSFKEFQTNDSISISSTMMSEEQRNCHVYDQSFMQLKSSKICESLISSKISDEIIAKFHNYTDKLSKLKKKSLSQTNDVSIVVSESEKDSRTNSILLENNLCENSVKSKIGLGDDMYQCLNCLWEHPSFKLDQNPNKLQKSENVDSRIESEPLSLILDATQQIQIQSPHLDSEFTDHGYLLKKTYGERSRQDIKKQYSVATINEIDFHKGTQLTWSKDTKSSSKTMNTNSLGTSNESQIDSNISRKMYLLDTEYSMEVQVEACEETNYINNDADEKPKYVVGKYLMDSTKRQRKDFVYSNRNRSQLMAANSNYSLNNFEINQQGDTHMFEIEKDFCDKVQPNSVTRHDKKHTTFLTSSNPEHYDAVYATEINDDIWHGERYKKSKYEVVSDLDKTETCRSILKSSTIILNSKTVRPERKTKDYGCSISKIVDGRFRHGWLCSYKECLAFNSVQRPTCSNCFNPRWCQPYRSKRDTMCRDCGYINYKSRLYCKKCKYMFFPMKK